MVLADVPEQRRKFSSLLCSASADTSTSHKLRSSSSPLTAFLRYPIHVRFRADDSRFVSHVEQAAHGFAAIGAVVQCALIDVHADKLVRRLRIQIAGKLHGVRQSSFAMVKPVLNAVTQRGRDRRHEFRAKRAANDVAAYWQRQDGPLLPPSVPHQ